MEELSFVLFTVVYPPHNGRPQSIVKTWKVAVKTSEPDERFESHDAWMLHILLEHTYTLTLIAEIETNEMRQIINAYKAVGISNRKTVRASELKKLNH